MDRQRAAKAVVAAALAASAMLPAGASATLTELGTFPDAVRGSCPGNPLDAESCQALTRTTGYQAKIGPDRGLYQAPADGRIVAWTVGLGNPSKKQLDFFEERYGGGPQAAVVILDPDAKLVRNVVAKSSLQKLADYLGRTVQFPLAVTLPIKKDQYVALTVPTWAPVMQLGLGPETSWRSSRAATGCLDITTQFAMVGKRTSAMFRCLYKGVRLTYSATFISDPTAAAAPAPPQ
jgi:hypothetical protein